MQGWISLHRQIVEWEWYNEPNTFRLFIHLLLKANHKPKKWQGKTIEAGELVTGRKQLAQELKLSEQKIRTSLERLKSTNEITIKSTSKFSVITICKWETYQPQKGIEQPTEQPAAQPTNNQQITTNNNDNNDNKGKRVAFAPPSLPEIQSYFAIKIAEKQLSLNAGIEAEKFLSHYSSNGWQVGKNKMKDWKAAINGWVAREKGKLNGTPHKETTYQKLI